MHETDHASERLELEAVLASGIFHRAPNLAQLLTYVCGEHFQGAAEQIKEYNIAVDALGRPADFDQKRDSIVRVEAYRLRKRLREYYASEGAGHTLRIEIPSGQYAPRFVVQAMQEPGVADMVPALPPALSDEIDVEAPAEMAEVLAPVARVPAGRGSRGVFTFVLLFCTGALALWRVPIAKSTHVAGSAVSALAAPGGVEELRILAGHLNGDYKDRLGRVWQADRYFEGGRVFENPEQPVLGTREPRIYQSRREGDFSYSIPLAAGTYELRLHFAETLFGENNVAGGGESSRVFNVYINGEKALSEFDVINEVGPSAADVRAFKDIAPGNDGLLHLRLEPTSNPAMLSAIEITPGVKGSLSPIRMVAADRVYTDKQGRVWEPDRYARGGLLIQRAKPVEGTADSGLLSGERYGNLRYVIPVPPGRYGVTLYFAEAWFGPGRPPGGGAGSRVFDILGNGVVLRHGFDIFKEAGGSGRATSFTVHGMEPDAQGKLSIALVPTRNYASINAIEIVDESGRGR